MQRFSVLGGQVRLCVSFRFAKLRGVRKDKELMIEDLRLPRRQTLKFKY